MKISLRVYFILGILLFSGVSAVPAKVVRVTPDSLAALREVERGDTLYFSEGLFKVNLVLEDNVSLVGAGQDRTILKALAPNQPVIRKSGRGTITGVTVEGSGRDWQSTPVYLNHSSAVIAYCTFRENTPYGVYASFFSGTIEYCRIEGNKTDGIKIYNSNGAVLRGNIIGGNEDDGIEALQSGLEIDSNVVRRNGGNAIEIWYDRGSSVKNNLLSDNGRYIEVVAGEMVSTFENNLGKNNVPLTFQSADEGDPNQAQATSNQQGNLPHRLMYDSQLIRPVLDILTVRESEITLDYRLERSPLESKLFQQLFKNNLDLPPILFNLAGALLSDSGYHEKIGIWMGREGIAETLREVPYGRDRIGRRSIRRLPGEVRAAVEKLLLLTDGFHRDYTTMFAEFTPGERQWMMAKIRSGYRETAEGEKTFREGFLSREEEIEENGRLDDLLRRVRPDTVFTCGKEIIEVAETLADLDWKVLAGRRASRDGIVFSAKTRWGKIIVADDSDQTHYLEDVFLFVDLGGNDRYYGEAASTAETHPVSILIDLGGNDQYLADGDYRLASAVGGVAFLLDRSGNDIYKGGRHSLGAASFGISILSDLSGDDIYQGTLYSQGLALFGFGMLDDQAGNDIYQAGAYCQGIGLPRGWGVISDRSGSDYYLSGNTITDSIRYYSHSITMSQGFGYGLRPGIPGGVGLLLDREGNDIYRADVFGQGGGYWLGLGGLIDLSGDDQYLAHRYSQGAGVHLAVGGMIDREGNDLYSSFSVSLGCGHDFGLGYFLDSDGDDNYRMESMGLGASSANGMGIFVDEAGSDGYLTRNKDHSYFNRIQERQDAGLAIFYDRAGRDRYIRYENNQVDIRDFGVFYDE